MGIKTSGMGRMRKKILLIGDGGHCRSIFDSVSATGIYDDIGVVVKDNVDPTAGHDLPVAGKDAELAELYADGWQEAFISLGSIGDVSGRRRLYQMVKAIGFAFPVITDPTAVVAKNAVIGEGVFIGKKAVVNAGSSVEKCAIINTGAIIEHDCSIGAFSHISSGAVLCGGIKVGDGTHIGAGTVIRQIISIGDDTMIGAGSVVVRDIPSHVKAYGNPCRVVIE